MVQKKAFSPTSMDNIYSYRPFSMAIKSKNIELSLGFVVGFSTCVHNKVDYTHPEDHCLHGLFISHKLKNGKISKSTQFIKFNDIQSSIFADFHNQFHDTPEKQFFMSIKKKAQEDFDNEVNTHGYSSRKVKSFQNNNIHKESINELYQTNNANINQAEIALIESKIRQLNQDLKEPYNQNKWIEKEMITELKSKINNY